jgi:hypothetical protein
VPNRQETKDGKRWQCKVCRAEFNVCDGSFFKRSKLTLQQIIVIINHWVEDQPERMVMKEAEISKKTAMDNFNCCRDECANWLIRNLIEIRGFGEDSQVIKCCCYSQK